MLGGRLFVWALCFVALLFAFLFSFVMADVGFENAQMKELMASLHKEKGVLQRKFNRDQTIVEQGSTNSCFFKLENGSIRFEKRVVGANKVVEKV